MFLELFAYRGRHPRRAMADIQAADASCKIEISVSVDVFDDRAFGARRENRRGIRWATWNCCFTAHH
jgi:hypothetical protein